MTEAGRTREQPSAPAPAPRERMLVVKIGGIGDYILTTPALRALRVGRPLAQIDLLATEQARALLERLGLVDTFLSLPPSFLTQQDGAPPRIEQSLGLVRRLRGGGYDTLLVLEHLVKEPRIQMLRSIVHMVGARRSIGLDNGRGDFLDVHVTDHGIGARHTAEYYLDVVAAAGVPVGDRRLYFPLSDDLRAQAAAWLPDGLRRPLIALHPGCDAVVLARRWAAGRFAQTADRLHQMFGGTVLLMGGPEEAGLRAEVIQAMSVAGPHTICGSGHESLSLAAALLAQCDLFVGNDSGLMHLAAAVGTPTVAIFGMSNHRAWGPYTGAPDSPAVVVRQDLPCMPCYMYGHSEGTREGCATRDCLALLAVDRVVEAAAGLLRAAHSRNS